MNQYNIWLALLEYISHSSQHTGSDIIQVLSLLHDVEIIIWFYLKYIQYLVEHLSVLTSYTNDGLKPIIMLLKLFYQWAHFYCLWTSSED